MTRAIILAPGAEDDLAAAAAFYEMQEPGLGDAFVRAIEAVAVWHERRRPEGWTDRIDDVDEPPR